MSWKQQVPYVVEGSTLKRSELRLGTTPVAVGLRTTNVLDKLIVYQKENEPADIYWFSFPALDFKTYQRCVSLEEAQKEAERWLASKMNELSSRINGYAEALLKGGME